jgi:hypothetical protein
MPMIKGRINSAKSLNTAIWDISKAFEDHNYAEYTIHAGKRTLDQNALKAVWYGHIAKFRGDTTAKEVERECKYNYGVPILSRDPFKQIMFSALNQFDSAKEYNTKRFGKLTGLEIKYLAMDSFSVTSIMTVEELSEYLTMMQTDYPFLHSSKERTFKAAQVA